MKRFFVTAMAVALIGCTGVAVRTEGTRLERDQVLNIKAGSTTRADVVELFGEPTNTKYEGDRERLFYVFKETKTPTYVGGIVENKSRSEKKTATLEIVVKDDVVLSYRFKNVED
ncbi:MAG TPA: outer membrane protein assembly factor BamE [Thermodesulfobacteriota bacterium]|nr:outer membrane protein assembly factor BamE [Thermodesulfobacteriota bacterium]